MKGQDEEACDKDERTIFVRGFSEKMTEKLLYELFFQAGPLERVAIPKDSDGNIKTFGFVTYKHLASVSYAMNIFAGTRIFGREISMKSRRIDSQQQQFASQSMTQSHQPASLLYGYNNNNSTNLHPFTVDILPAIQNQQQQLIQQQLIRMATGQNLQNYVNPAAPNFIGASSFDHYASTRGDSSGSKRDHYVDRHRYHREEDRTNRSNPYRRSRSRSPYREQQSFRNRERSPKPHQNRVNEKGRKTDERSNYHRWGKR